MMEILGKDKITVFIFVFLWFISQWGFAQEAAQTIPDSLRRPERGEAPRYPNDLVIGELGRGGSPEGAYYFAISLLSALTAGNRGDSVFADSGLLLSENLFEEIRGIRARNYRLGGGRIEADGCVSFLVRFIGPEESITGELFIRRAEAEEDDGSGVEKWLHDDLILENKRALNEITDNYRYNFSPYERFY
jgi:hypothetical protein